VPRGASEAGAEAQAAGNFGGYEIIRPLARGGMGEVFLARKVGPAGFEKRVVLKCLLPQYASDPARLEMFIHEARVVARLSHPNVVQTFDLGTINDRHFMAMEYIEGQDLLKVIRRSRKNKTPFPVELCCWLGSEVAAALNAAHSYVDENGRPEPIIHRDVSPENILISTDGTVKLADFGVAKALAAIERRPTGSFVGKPSYTSPERISHPKEAFDGRVDIFSLGTILFEVLLSRPCFQRANDAATVFAIVNEPTPVPSSIRRDIPPELDQIILRATAKDPAERYATARELGRDLARVTTRLGLPAGATQLSEHMRELFGGADTQPSAE
jgi:serine/threonine protein kinase